MYFYSEDQRYRLGILEPGKFNTLVVVKKHLMERVKTLLSNLLNQFESGAGSDEMLVTLQMLQAELMQEAASGTSRLPAGISVDLPSVSPAPLTEKVVQVLQIDESDVAAELNELKTAMKSRDILSVANKPSGIFEPAVEKSQASVKSPPAIKPVEIHEKLASAGEPSLHDSLRQEVGEVSDMVREPAIADLRKGIGVNDRFTFINELFRGDEEAYEISIRAINGFADREEAEQWIGRELKNKLGWDNENPVVHQFDALVRRRFSRM